ncbi:hypothetical protein [Moorena producens]|uniref:hypothetical protein n=1 Tax=Moorena producens TaxID=1155739 RepID=UPI0011EA6B1E|nr:hypothetical protein [Moorena producens]
MRFPCLDAVAHGGNPQDRAASLGELNSPRVAPLPTPVPLLGGVRGGFRLPTPYSLLPLTQDENPLPTVELL